MSDLDKYVLEQAKIEVEHTRSWPTKILAFYVAINAGIVTTLLAIERSEKPQIVPCSVKTLITVAILVLLAWVFYLLQKNHKSYLTHRSIQVQYQLANKEEIEKKFNVPPEWYKNIDVSLGTRWQGWGFYFYLVVLVTALGITGVWVS